MSNGTAPAPPAGDNPWTGRLGRLVMTHVAGTVSVVSVLTMSPAITRDLDLSAVEFGFFLTAYYVAQAVCSLPAGGLVDRLGVGRALVLCHALMLLGPLILSRATGFPAALVALALMGVGYSISNPATARGVFEWFPPERRATAMGIKQVGVPLGGIAAAGNGALAAIVPWQHLMLGVAGLILLSGLLCLGLARHPVAAKARGNPLASIGEVLRDWNHNRFVFVGLLHNFGQTNFYAFLTLFMREAAAASQPLASLAVGVAQVASACGRVGWGVVSDRLFKGRRKGLVVAMTAAAGAFFLVLVAVGEGGTGLGLALALGLGLTVASAAPLLQTLSVEATEPRLAGSAMGVNMVGVHVGGMIGPPVFGFAVDRLGGYAAGWALSGVVMLAAALVLGLWFRERGRG